MKINSDISNLNTTNLNKVKEQQEKSLERLATGLKINSASDDVAGFQIAQRLFSQASGIQVAVRNANDAYSYASVADSAFESVTDASQRVNELSIQAANGTLSAADRKAIQSEITQLQQQVSDVQQNTTFAGQQIFGNSQNKNFQVGANAGEQIGFSTSSFNEQIEQFNSIDVTTQAGAQAAIETSQGLIQDFGASRSQIGAFQNRITSTINNLNNVYVQTESARSRIEDADFAQESANLVQQQIQTNISTAMAGQANSNQQVAASLLN
ncbi:flagellin [Psychrosphaera sp.]|nr:flagellin [Psychrosphaera sp.]